MRKVIPEAAKQHLKDYLLSRLSAQPEIVARIATRVARVGIPNYLTWNYAEEKFRILNYLNTRRIGEFEYTFSNSSTKPTLYASIYACMLKALYGELHCISGAHKQAWLNYFNSFQSKSDGLFRDPVIAGEAYESGGAWGDGWGIRHLAGHLIIAYTRLGGTPPYPFRFLEPYYDEQHLQSWLATFDFSKNVWSSSNYIMNLYTLLQYARDFLGESRAAKPIGYIHQWLSTRQRKDTGMWHTYELNGYPMLGDAIRGAYHFYPLYLYERKPILYREQAIDWILKSQNSWGAFEQEGSPSGACEDIDALDPLIRFVLQTGHRKTEAELAVRRALVWILANRHADGGYESLMENGCHYGNHPETSSKPQESNLFATWFRTLNLAYVVKFLGLENGYDIGRFPGYELPLD